MKKIFKMFLFCLITIGGFFAALGVVVSGNTVGSSLNTSIKPTDSIKSDTLNSIFIKLEDRNASFEELKKAVNVRIEEVEKLNKFPYLTSSEIIMIEFQQKFLNSLLTIIETIEKQGLRNTELTNIKNAFNNINESNDKSLELFNILMSVIILVLFGVFTYGTYVFFKNNQIKFNFVSINKRENKNK